MSRRTESNKSRVKVSPVIHVTTRRTTLTSLSFAILNIPDSASTLERDLIGSEGKVELVELKRHEYDMFDLAFGSTGGRVRVFSVRKSPQPPESIAGTRLQISQGRMSRAGVEMQKPHISGK